MNTARIKTTFLKFCSYTITLGTMLVLYVLGWKLIVFTLPFMILGAAGIILAGEGEIDYHGFKVKTFIGTYLIDWKAVDYIEIGAGNMIMGNSKQRIAFPAPEYWSGNEKEKAFEIFDNVLESKNIEIKETSRAILPIYFGTKIKK